MAALALLAAMLGAGPAEAHRLKVFATVEGATIAGYAYFVGGGRAEAAALSILTGAGAEAHRGATGADGGFAWRPPAPGDFVVAVDAGDGHVAEARIAADRFAAPAPAGAPAPGDTAAGPADRAAGPGDGAGAAAAPPLDEARLAALVDAAVERAVARQVRPLLEAYDRAEARLRFNDVAGGVGTILGFAGIALWVSARRRRSATARPEAPRPETARPETGP